MDKAIGPNALASRLMEYIQVIENEILFISNAIIGNISRLEDLIPATHRGVRHEHPVGGTEVHEFPDRGERGAADRRGCRRTTAIGLRERTRSVFAKR